MNDEKVKLKTGKEVNVHGLLMSWDLVTDKFFDGNRGFSQQDMELVRVLFSLINNQMSYEGRK
jgi:hypothetical protein